MSLTSTVHISETSETDGYPYLGKLKNADGKKRIVLFTAPGSGVVVHAHLPWHGVGHYSKGWSEEQFERMTPGSFVTLKTPTKERPDD